MYKQTKVSDSKHFDLTTVCNNLHQTSMYKLEICKGKNTRFTIELFDDSTYNK